jgi:hypothetical protein|tara:strand:+ start:82 stop:327 length:246 start_codon:yes stop_codon:yes gene_type:complete
MNKTLEWYVIIFLVLILITLSGCAEKEINTANNPKLPDTVSNPVDKDGSGVQNIPLIVNALTCMFAPDTCESVKQEQEMDR